MLPESLPRRAIWMADSHDMRGHLAAETYDRLIAAAGLQSETEPFVSNRDDRVFLQSVIGVSALTGERFLLTGIDRLTRESHTIVLVISAIPPSRGPADAGRFRPLRLDQIADYLDEIDEKMRAELTEFIEEDDD